MATLPSPRDAGSLLLVHEENSRGVQHSSGERVLLARKLASAVLCIHAHMRLTVDVFSTLGGWLGLS